MYWALIVRRVVFNDVSENSQLKLAFGSLNSDASLSSSKNCWVDGIFQSDLERVNAPRKATKLKWRHPLPRVMVTFVAAEILNLVRGYLENSYNWIGFYSLQFLENLVLYLIWVFFIGSFSPSSLLILGIRVSK